MDASKSKILVNILRGLSLAFVLGLTIYLYLHRSQLSNLQGYGYPGIFVVSLITNASLFMPVPGVIITSAMGAIFNPFWVAIAAGSGSAVGEMTGYLAGYSGQGVVSKAGIYEKIVGWMKKYGDVTILVLAIIPNPFFDGAGIIAGMLKMPAYRFFLWCLLGKIIKMLFFAYGGSAISSYFNP
jgi:membrane protein YqaA with SNARE-associated domain